MNEGNKRYVAAVREGMKEDNDEEEEEKEKKHIYERCSER